MPKSSGRNVLDLLLEDPEAGVAGMSYLRKKVGRSKFMSGRLPRLWKGIWVLF